MLHSHHTATQKAMELSADATQGRLLVMTNLSQMRCFIKLTQIASLQVSKIKITDPAATASPEMFQNSKSRTD